MPLISYNSDCGISVVHNEPISLSMPEPIKSFSDELIGSNVPRCCQLHSYTHIHRSICRHTCRKRCLMLQSCQDKWAHISYTMLCKYDDIRDMQLLLRYMSPSKVLLALFMRRRHSYLLNKPSAESRRHKRPENQFEFMQMC